MAGLTPDVDARRAGAACRGLVGAAAQRIALAQLAACALECSVELAHGLALLNLHHAGIVKLPVVQIHQAILAHCQVDQAPTLFAPVCIMPIAAKR